MNNLCKCGCGAAVKPGNSYASRRCSNAVHAVERQGVARKRPSAKRCGFHRPQMTEGLKDIGMVKETLGACKKALADRGCPKRRFN